MASLSQKRLEVKIFALFSIYKLHITAKQAKQWKSIEGERMKQCKLDYSPQAWLGIYTIHKEPEKENQRLCIYKL